MKAQICISTYNQTINLIPALNIKSDIIFILSSPTARNQRWTSRLCLVLNRKGIKNRVIDFDDGSKETVSKFIEELYILCTDERIETLYFNISGGKKSQTLALLELYYTRMQSKYEDYIIYTESQPFEISFYREFVPQKTQLELVGLGLEDILNLYGYTTFDGKKNQAEVLEQPSSSLDVSELNNLFIDNTLFREFFFNYLQPKEPNVQDKDALSKKIRMIIDHYKPLEEEVFSTVKNPKLIGYENLATAIDRHKSSRNPAERTQVIREIYRIPNVSSLFHDYWSQVKKAMISKLMDHIQEESPAFYLNYIDDDCKDRVLSMIEKCGGSISYRQENDTSVIDQISFGHSKGELFEVMVQQLVSSFLSENADYTLITAAYKNVRTFPLNYDDSGNVIYPQRYMDHENDDELDIVLVTKYGTLVVFEAKTFGFEGDVIKSQRDTIFTKSGPFGEVCFITPLISGLADSGGMFPEYVPVSLVESVKNFNKHGIKYCCFDDVKSLLARKYLYRDRESS